MKKLYSNIKNRRVELDMTQTDLAKKMGYASKSMIAKIENGQVDISQSKIEQFAEALDLTPGELMGTEGTVPAHKGVRIPIAGRVAAGIPIEAIENIIDYEEIPESMARTGDYIGLQIKGDSMEPDFHDGDYVIVRRQPDAESGEIVIAIVNGYDGVCKKLKKLDDGGIMLISLNSKYEPMIFKQSEIDQIPVSIFGKVVELRRKF